LDALRREAIYRQDQLPIPVSFLIDAQSRLRVVYAGPAAPEQLREDVAALSIADPDENLARAVPFPGRWSEDLFLTHPIAIATIYREEGEFEDAREYLRRHLAAEPAPPASDTTPAAAAARRRLADVHHLLGQIAIDSREPDVARESLRTAIQFYPQHLPSLLDLGDLYLSTGEAERARETLVRAASLAPQDPRPCNKLGLVDLAQGRPVEAKQQFERAVALQPRYFPAANNLAWLLATHADDRVRDGRHAVKIAEQTAKQVGPRPDVLDTLAAAYAEVGDFAKAVDVADLAVRNAERAQQSDLARVISLRRAGYLAQQPFREPLVGRQGE